MSDGTIGSAVGGLGNIQPNFETMPLEGGAVSFGAGNSANSIMGGLLSELSMMGGLLSELSMREADADSIELADQETVRAVSDEFVNAETGASTAIGGKGSLAIPLEFQSGGLLLSGPPLFWNAEGSSFAGWER